MALFVAKIAGVTLQPENVCVPGSGDCAGSTVTRDLQALAR